MVAEMETVPTEERIHARVRDSYLEQDVERMAYLNRVIADYYRCRRCGTNLPDDGPARGVCSRCLRRTKAHARRLLSLTMRLAPSPAQAAPEAAPDPTKLMPRVVASPTPVMRATANQRVRRLRTRQARARRG